MNPATGGRSGLDRLIDFEVHRGGDISPSRLARLRHDLKSGDVERYRAILRSRSDLREVRTSRGGSRFVPLADPEAAPLPPMEVPRPPLPRAPRRDVPGPACVWRGSPESSPLPAPRSFMTAIGRLVLPHGPKAVLRAPAEGGKWADPPDRPQRIVRSVERLALETGLSSSTIKRSLRYLERWQLVRRRPRFIDASRGHRANEYEIDPTMGAGRWVQGEPTPVQGEPTPVQGEPTPVQGEPPYRAGTAAGYRARLQPSTIASSTKCSTRSRRPLARAALREPTISQPRAAYAAYQARSRSGSCARYGARLRKRKASRIATSCRPASMNRVSGP